ncbi:MAG: serine hydrolase domain-containing protein [Vicinamibacterales bacterium]
MAVGSPGLESAAKAGAALPRLRSLLVSHRGELVLERYYGGARPAQAANIKSASKSVISALVGIAVSRGLIKGLDQPIADFFPELAKDPERRKREITIEDLLTMRSGLESTSGRNYGAWVQSPNWVRYVLNRPLIDEPGTRVEYSTGTSHLLSAILTKATRTSTWQFAQESLAKPLGFVLPRWLRDPQGVYFGGNEMSITPRQMVRFGELYLNEGRAGGAQVLPKDWVAKTRVPRGKSRWGSDREYGYGFWIRELAGHDSYYAWGYGGQFVFIVPDLQLVVVTTSRSDVSRERRDHLGAIYDLVEQQVIPAVKTAAPPSP